MSEMRIVADVSAAGAVAGDLEFLVGASGGSAQTGGMPAVSSSLGDGKQRRMTSFLFRRPFPIELSCSSNRLRYCNGLCAYVRAR